MIQVTKTDKLTLRHGLVVLTGILILLGPCALVYNTWSVFVVPVSTSLDSSAAQFSIYITLVYLVGAFTSPIAGNLLEKYDLRLVLSASVVLVALGIFLCVFWTEVWQFYISGLIEGVGIVALMFLAVPTLINRWFSVRTGFLIGLCMAMSGVGGALWSLVAGFIMAAADWRVAYLVFAIATLVTALPATLWFIRSYPHELGLQRYGDKASMQALNKAAGVEPIAMVSDELVEESLSESAEEGDSIPASVMFKSPVFYLLIISVSLFNALTAVGNLFASYIYHLSEVPTSGVTAESAIMMASITAACLMIFAAIGKVSLGALTDKTALGALILACGLGVISMLCMWQALTWSFAMYIGAAAFGFVYAAVDALGPTITRNIAGPKDYTIIYSRIAIFINIAGAAAVAIFAAISEISWDLEWIVTLVILAVIFITGVLAIRGAKSLRKTQGKHNS